MRRGWAWAGCVGLVISLVVAVPAGALRVEGTDGDDVLIGTPDSDLIVARAGDDVVYARAGNDTVKPGPGDDELHLGPGHDAVWYTGEGDDVVYGGQGREWVVLSKGHDQAFTGPDRDYVEIQAPYSSIIVRMGAGNDFGGRNGAETDLPVAAHHSIDLSGGPGRDTLSYWNPEDFYSPIGPWWKTYAPRAILRGGRGADEISVLLAFPSGTYTVIAGPGADRVDTDGYTRVSAGRGDDEIRVAGPGNVIDCGTGTDTVIILDPGSDDLPPTQTPAMAGCEKVIDRR
jgi:Ca2+-binding RTX toxin-like protein